MYLNQTQLLFGSLISSIVKWNGKFKFEWDECRKLIFEILCVKTFYLKKNCHSEVGDYRLRNSNPEILSECSENVILCGTRIAS